VRELQLIRSGRLAWRECDPPRLEDRGDAIVRPFVAGRCDGDTVPVHRPVSRGLQAGIALGLIDPVVGCICGKVPFKGPFAIGHECVAEVVAVGAGVERVRIGQRVVVPWAVSCGSCPRCLRGLTSKCATTVQRALAAFGFGAASGPWGGMIADEIRVPFADHMLVPVPDGVPPVRVAAASDNLADAWRSVVPPLAEREGAWVLILGGGAKSIGLYAAGLAVAHGASVVDYLDDHPERRRIAESFGARARPRSDLKQDRRGPARGRGYDVVVEATSRASGLRHPRTGSGRRLHGGRLLPGFRHARATDANVCHRRDASSWRFPRSRRAPRPAGLRRAQRVPRRTRRDAHRRLGGRPQSLRGQDHQGRAATPPARGRVITA
jgi:threonine dehydrogenase-like Zn-dependent dehydrogenase